MTVLAPCRAEWFERWEGSRIKNRGAEYKEYKEQWAALLLESLYQHWPETKGHVVYSDVATPLSNDFYLNSSKGEVYGLEHTTSRYDSLPALLALHPETAVPGLFLTGQDTVNVGIVSALMSGVLTAARVSYRAALRCVLELLVA